MVTQTKPLAASAFLATVFSCAATAQPAVFSPSIEKECVLEWFQLSADSTLADLSRVYSETPPMRLAAVLNICSARAGSTARPCDEMCAAEIQVLIEMRGRKNPTATLQDIERLR